MRIVVVGAGVIGTVNAAWLQAGGGHEVLLLARGDRLRQLRQHGVALEHVPSGRRTAVFVPLVDHLDPATFYDLVLVAVRRDQVGDVLPLLAEHRRSPNVLFLGNNAAGPGQMVAALGPERVLLGLPNAGGQRVGHVVRYIGSPRWPLLFGEADGTDRPRDREIRAGLRKAGLFPVRVRDIDAHQKTHAAGVPAFAGAVYLAGGDVRRLAHDRAAVRTFLTGYREALAALRADGTRLRPPMIRLVEVMPPTFLATIIAPFLDSRWAVVGGQAHAEAAPEEMRELAGELRSIFARTGVPHPASDLLFRAIEDRARGIAHPAS